MTSFRYDPYIDKYLFDIKENRIKSNKLIKQLMIFLENKLNNSDVIIDHEIIEEAIELTEKYFFKLLDWQKFFYAFVFGVRYKDGSLMFNEFLLMMGRGAGKNGLIAALCFCLVYLLEIKNYNITMVATSEKQAKTSFNEIWEILESDKPRFRQHFKWTKEVIIHRRSRSTISFATSNPKTADGGRPGAIVFDEIHAYEDDEQIKVHTSGLGKRKDPRRFYITTDGNVRDGFLDSLKDEAELILNGDRPNRRTFMMIYKLDDKKEVHDKNLWIKANPSINAFPDLRREMEDEYEKLKDRPSSKLEFMTKRMNMPEQDSYQAVAIWENVKATNQQIPDLKGYECIGGLDYSDTEDFTCVGLLFKCNEKVYWMNHSFINRKSIERQNYKVPIDLAVKQGLATIVEEETNRPEILADWFIEKSKDYKIKMIASDMYRIGYVRDKFEELGLPTLEMARSGSKTHTILRPKIDDLFAYQNLVFGDDLLMRWYVNNTYVKTDGKGNITYEKIDPKLRKTDGFFAFLHALQFMDEINDYSSLAYEPRKLKTYTY